SPGGRPHRPSALDDQRGALQHADVGQRIAVDDDEVGDESGLYLAEVAQAEQLGGAAGGGDDGVARGHAEIDHDGEFAGVVAVGKDTGVGAEGDLDPRLDRAGEAVAHARGDEPGLGGAVGRELAGVGGLLDDASDVDG